MRPVNEPMEMEGLCPHCGHEEAEVLNEEPIDEISEWFLKCTACEYLWWEETA